MNEPEPAAEFHELTKHGVQRPFDRTKFVDFQPLDPTNRPAPFKRYVDLEVRPLPRDLGDVDVRAVDALSGRVPSTASAVADTLDETVLARLLFLSGGVTRTTDVGRTFFRAAMSAGNLHPVELYLASADGLDHFAPREFGLTRLRDGDVRPTLAAAIADPRAIAAPLSIVLTGIPWRTAWKYGERGFRHLYWDAGTLLANLLAVCEAHRLEAQLRLGFVDDDVCHLVGIDGDTEMPLAVVVIGGRDEPPAGKADAVDDESTLDAAIQPLSPRPVRFPLIADTQAAGALDDAAAVAAWRVGPSTPPPAAVDPPDGVDALLDEVILRRGSTRAFRHETAPTALLRWGVAAAARPVPADAPDLLVHLLSVHAVEDTVPGLYRWHGDHPAAGREGDPREAAQQVCLGQPLGGDSAFTAFHAADLDDVLGRFGSRGYRVAQLQAGVASGRLALAAFALGCGATGLTFFDDLVSRLFGNPAACMLVTAVGVPDYRNRAGGRPGETTELPGFQRLMERLALDLRRRR